MAAVVLANPVAYQEGVTWPKPSRSTVRRHSSAASIEPWSVPRLTPVSLNGTAEADGEGGRQRLAAARTIRAFSGSAPTLGERLSLKRRASSSVPSRAAGTVSAARIKTVGRPLRDMR